jgi:hypothetical protein
VLSSSPAGSLLNKEEKRIMNNELKLERDSFGDLVSRSITSWRVSALYDLGAIMNLNYVEEAEARSIQLILGRQQCLDLAQALIEQAKLIPDKTAPCGNRTN